MQNLQVYVRNLVEKIESSISAGDITLPWPSSSEKVSLSNLKMNVIFWICASVFALGSIIFLPINVRNVCFQIGMNFQFCWMNICQKCLHIGSVHDENLFSNYFVVSVYFQSINSDGWRLRVGVSLWSLLVWIAVIERMACSLYCWWDATIIVLYVYCCN